MEIKEEEEGLLITCTGGHFLFNDVDIFVFVLNLMTLLNLVISSRFRRWVSLSVYLLKFCDILFQTVLFMHLICFI